MKFHTQLHHITIHFSGLGLSCLQHLYKATQSLLLLAFWCHTPLKLWKGYFGIKPQTIRFTHIQDKHPTHWTNLPTLFVTFLGCLSFPFSEIDNSIKFKACFLFNASFYLPSTLQNSKTTQNIHADKVTLPFSVETSPGSSPAFPICIGNSPGRGTAVALGLPFTTIRFQT